MLHSTVAGAAASGAAANPEAAAAVRAAAANSAAIGELGGERSCAFFGAAKAGSLSKRGGSSLSSWQVRSPPALPPVSPRSPPDLSIFPPPGSLLPSPHDLPPCPMISRWSWQTRWLALDGEHSCLRYFDKAPELVESRRLVCLLRGTTLRVHEASRLLSRSLLDPFRSLPIPSDPSRCLLMPRSQESYLLSLALGDGNVVQLRAATREHLALWTQCLAASGCALDAAWQPAAPMSGRPAQAAAGGQPRAAARWRCLVPSYEILSDERGREFACFSVRTPRGATAPFGSLRIPSDPFGSLRILPSDPFGSSLRIPSDPFGSLRIPSDPFRSLPIPPEPFRALSSPSDPFSGGRLEEREW